MEFTQNDLNKTVWVKPGYLEKNRKRFQVDAEGKTLGRLAVEIANHLSWKNKAHSCDFWDAGDFVVVHNVEKIKTTGYKIFQKMYYRYSGRKGNLKSMTLEDMMKKHPDRVMLLAVRGMLPKNKLRDRRMKRLKVFTWTSEKYAHLTPEVIN